MDSLFIERLKSNKDKDKATVCEYLYTLNRILLSYHIGYVESG